MLEETGATIEVERSTTKAPLTDEDVRDLVASARRVIVARGKSLRESAPEHTELEDLKGPTGNYRAPILLAGGTLLVGFNQEAVAGL